MRRQLIENMQGLNLASYWGGTEEGTCIQVTIAQGDGGASWVQLNVDQVHEVYQALGDWLELQL